MGLFRKKERFLGIDLSPSAVKLVELSQSSKGYQVDALAVEPLPEGSMEERNPSDLDQIGAAIKRAVKASGTGLKQAVLAVPTTSVVTRTITMPSGFGEDEIEANIQVEAAQYIPFPLEEIHLDFQVLGYSKGNEAVQDVMIVASRRENVDLREDVLREAGLKATIVDVEAYALENLFPLIRDDLPASPLSKSKTGPDAEPRTAIIDIGAAVTTLYVFQGERVIFTREQSFGGDQLVQSIAENYGLPRDRAALAMRSGELSEDYPTTILEPFKQDVAEQISNALQFFFAASHYNSVDNIVLVGGGGMIPDLDKVVANTVSIPTVVGNPFERMSTAKRINRRTLLRDAPLFAVACGLAMRSFDL